MMAELTAEEKAIHIEKLAHALAGKGPNWFSLPNEFIDSLVAFVFKAEEEARQEEREACAVLAQRWEDLVGIAPNIADVIHQVVAAIRAQSLDQALSTMAINNKGGDDEDGSD